MRRFIASCITLAAAVAFTACALAQAPEKTKLTIGVGGKTLFYYLPLTIAEQKGYFKDEGLDVEITDFAGGSKALAGPDGRQRRRGVGRLRAHASRMQAKGQNIEGRRAAGQHAAASCSRIARRRRPRRSSRRPTSRA